MSTQYSYGAFDNLETHESIALGLKSYNCWKNKEGSSSMVRTLEGS
jgi:hypothetical protein